MLFVYKIAIYWEERNGQTKTKTANQNRTG